MIPLRTFFRPPKTEDTQRFYAGIVSGEKHKHHPWGKETRFNSEKASKSPSVKKYFTAKVTPLLRPTDTVLDMGCGSGLFLPSLSPLCRELVAFDVSPDFVRESRATVEKFGLANTTVVQGEAETLPFPDGTFDAALVSDTIHHLCHVERSMDELKRVLKPGARSLVFEPNILNPALLLMCLFDRNEWGALGLCRKSAYEKLFKDRFRIESMEYNGLLIGPDSPAFLKVADLLNRKNAAALLGWLNPKIFISLRNA